MYSNTSPFDESRYRRLGIGGFEKLDTTIATGNESHTYPLGLDILDLGDLETESFVQGSSLVDRSNRDSDMVDS